MDGVIVDFGHQIDIINTDPKISKEHKSSPDQIDGIFRDPQPVKDSIESIIKLYNSGLTI